MPELSTQEALYPDYRLFRSVCQYGLSTVRPLGKHATPDKDRWDWNFGSGYPPSYWAYGRMRAMITTKEAAAMAPKKVLEVAAGDAALSACLAEMGCETTANDLRGDALVAAVGNFSNSDRIRCLPGNLFDLDPVKVGRFDLVIACEIVEHVAHTVEFLSQLKKFLAPNGRILLTTPNGAYFRNKLPTHAEITDFNELEKSQFKPDDDGHLFLITAEEMRSLAKEAGLSVERLVLWGTPVVTGHVRLAKLSNPAACWLCFQLERFAQRLPLKLREKLCFNLLTVLAAS